MPRNRLLEIPWPRLRACRFVRLNGNHRHKSVSPSVLIPVFANVQNPSHLVNRNGSASSKQGGARCACSPHILLISQQKDGPHTVRLKPVFLSVVIVSLVILSISLPATCLDASHSAEAMFRGDPEHSGVYNTAGVAMFSKVKWKFHTGGQVISSPAVSGGVVFVGSTDGTLYAVDHESGALKWKFAAKSRISSSPAVAKGLVYFGAYDGNFYAVDAATGQVKWKFQTAGERRFAGTHLHGSQPAAESMPDPFDFYLSSPVLWEGEVCFGSGDGNIYALDAASGALRWKFKTGDVVHASPAIADGTLFIGSWDSYFYALDANTGKEKWRFKTGEDPDTHNQVGIQSSAAVVEGVVYFGCRDSNFYAVDAATGQKKWVFSNHGSWVISSPAVRAGKVYFATSDTALFYSLDAKTGSPVFSLKFQGWPMFSSPAVAGDMVYIGSHMGRLIAIDVAAQKTSWTFETDGAKQNAAAWTKADGTPNYDVAFASDFYDDIVTGVSKMMAVGTILSSPVVEDGVIYFGSADGNLYALM
jgi:outer membrane protein assembly factor BamB